MQVISKLLETTDAWCGNYSHVAIQILKIRFMASHKKRTNSHNHNPIYNHYLCCNSVLESSHATTTWTSSTFSHTPVDHQALQFSRQLCYQLFAEAFERCCQIRLEWWLSIHLTIWCHFCSRWPTQLLQLLDSCYEGWNIYRRGCCQGGYMFPFGQAANQKRNSVSSRERGW